MSSTLTLFENYEILEYHRLCYSQYITTIGWTSFRAVAPLDDNLGNKFCSCFGCAPCLTVPLGEGTVPGAGVVPLPIVVERKHAGVPSSRVTPLWWK